MPALTLNDAAVFVAVVQNGTFAGAAKDLRMPTSTVSRVVSNLEARLGRQLLHRTTRSMTLTDLGRQYFEDVEAAVQAISDASSKLVQSETGLVYRLRLLASPDVGTEILPQLLVPFQAEHPNILIDVELTSTPPNLSGRGFDLALWGGPLPTSNLVRVTLQDDNFGLFAAPSYLERAGEPQTHDDLMGHSCILLRPDSQAPKWELRGPEKLHKFTPPQTFTANDVAFLRNMVLQGGGIGPLPIGMAQRWCAAGALVRVMPDYKMPGLPLYLLFPNRTYTTEPVKTLKRAIHAWSKNLERTAVQR